MRWAASLLVLWMPAACGGDSTVPTTGDAAIADVAAIADAPPHPPPDDAAAPADGSLGADTSTGWACAPEAVAGHQELDCPEGVHMDVEASDACAAGGCGVILDVHGFTMSGDLMDEHSRMRALAPPLDYVVIQPTAPGVPSSWGTGEHDDVVYDFLLATIDRFAIDPHRIHMMGFSQGGMMTYRMICTHAELFASVAPTAGTACFDGSEPAVELPILHTHGHEDAIISWSVFGAPQRDAILAAWPFGPPILMSQGSGYTATKWISASGTVFELWEHDYDAGILIGGHCLPGPDDGAPYRCNGSEFDLSSEILRFFMEHPKS
jgi:pimeloyl-ACP methyl ester carboxylesterase